MAGSLGYDAAGRFRRCRCHGAALLRRRAEREEVGLAIDAAQGDCIAPAESIDGGEQAVPCVLAKVSLLQVFEAYRCMGGDSFNDGRLYRIGLGHGDLPVTRLAHRT